MNQAKVSVCIPVYNGSPYIRDAIQSVLDQTFQDFEIIIVDNQSTDDTVKIVRSFTDPRIKFFQNETNLGIMANWNVALRHATGDYIKILPADDMLYSNCLALQVPVLENDHQNSIAMVCGRKDLIDYKGRILFSRGFSRRKIRLSGVAAINRTVRSGGNIIGEPASILFRRSILGKAGYFASEIIYVLDLDQWYKILSHGDLVSLPEIVCAFRISNASLSTIRKNNQKDDLIRFLKKIYRIPEYKISRLSYLTARINIELITFSKKLLYRFISR